MHKLSFIHHYTLPNPPSHHTVIISIGNKTWYVQGKVGLRGKSNGPGCHVSAFVGHSLGFGLRMIDHDTVLRLCNENRDD